MNTKTTHTTHSNGRKNLQKKTHKGGKPVPDSMGNVRTAVAANDDAPAKYHPHSDPELVRVASDVERDAGEVGHDEIDAGDSAPTRRTGDPNVD